MCPDRDLLSAWVDGEVDSPWRERIVLHLESCEACSATVARYRSLEAGLRSAGMPSVPVDESAMVVRVGNAVEAALSAMPVRKPRRSGESPVSDAFGHWWRRRVSLSLPIAAALGIALLGFGGVGLGLGVALGRGQPSSLTQMVRLPSATGQPANMGELLRALEAPNTEVTITFKAPSETRLDSSGSPVFQVAPAQGRVVSAPPQDIAP